MGVVEGDGRPALFYCLPIYFLPLTRVCPLQSAILWLVAQSVNLLQGSNYPTLNLVYPVIGNLLADLRPSEPLIFQDDLADKEFTIRQVRPIAPVYWRCFTQHVSC